jgi:hypothetical protein
MSQSGRLTGNQPVPGAGIETVTGNAGGAVPGDGSANINIVGTGTITVTGVPATNTLTIASTGTPATYTTDDHIPVVPSALGNLNVAGGSNINTNGFIANTVTINLDDTVTISGDLTAHDVDATESVTALLNVTAATGNVTALAGDIVGQRGLFNGTVLITAGGLDIVGTLHLSGLNNGIMQTNNIGDVSVSNGADGEVLIGGAGAPTWATLTPGNNISIVNGPASIEISADLDVASTYTTDSGDATPAADIIVMKGGSNINTAGAGNTVTFNLDPSVTVAGSLTAGTTVQGATVTSTGDMACGADIAIAHNCTVANALQVNGASTLSGAATFGAATITNGAATFNNGITVPTGNVVVSHAGAQVQANTLHATANLTVDAAGSTFLSGQTNGVLQTNNIGNVTATNGTNGQLLIGGGTAPEWGNLTSTGGSVAITYPGANKINLEAAGSNAAIAFKATLNTGVPWPDNLSTPYYTFGTKQAMTIIYNYGNTFYPGDGANAPATFTVPSTGVYNFIFKSCLGRDSSANDYIWTNIGCYLEIYSINTDYYYTYAAPTASMESPAHEVTYPHITNIETTEDTYLTAGDVIQFIMEVQTSDNYANNHFQIGPNYEGTGTCCISGHKIA